ncbi:MAG: hypothetical protein M3004_05925, partial [Bacteroidota bacterium]|nr:hypothetical protein [Bacteroidota bacterium]
MNADVMIALLVNPLANKKRTKKITAEIIETLSKKKIAFECFNKLWPNDINVYKEVWLVGGDGTINYFLNFYKPITIPIIIFKGGTGNDFAWKLYSDISVDEQIKKVLASPPQNVDAGECNGRIFINGVGIGFDGEVLQSINTIRWLGGHLGYLWIVLKKIFSFKEYNYTIRFDEQELNGKFLLVMITNSSRTGGGFMVSPSAKVNDGKLNM